MQTSAIAAFAADRPLGPTTITRRDPGPTEVAIDIAYAGICHSDIHTVRDEWSTPHYPLVPGHEITGTVTAIGPDVTRFAVGDRVGVGVIVDSCRECSSCRAGLENYCLDGPIWTYGTPGRDGEITQGGYSRHIVVEQDYTMRIPDALPLDATAPLLCAGITLYSPLRHWNAGPGRRVAIIGMGGLGHLGVKIAHALGAEVSVLSHSLRKADDARTFGADHYYATSDDATFSELRGSFDLVLNTSSANLDMGRLLSLLAVDGTLVAVGLPEHPLTVPANLGGRRHSLSSSTIGGMAETQEMLDFCAEHGITAEIETIDAAQVNEAHDRVVASDVRYRFVIDASTI